MIEFMNRYYWLWLTICITAGIALGLLLPSRACSQTLFDDPVYQCAVNNRPITECRALAREALKRPAIEGFIAARAEKGISRQAAIRSWHISRSSSIKTYSCKPDGKEFTCERE